MFVGLQMKNSIALTIAKPKVLSFFSFAQRGIGRLGLWLCAWVAAGPTLDWRIAMCQVAIMTAKSQIWLTSLNIETHPHWFGFSMIFMGQTRSNWTSFFFSWFFHGWNLHDFCHGTWHVARGTSMRWSHQLTTWSCGPVGRRVES